MIDTQQASLAWHRRHAWYLHIGLICGLVVLYFSLPPATSTGASVARVVTYLTSDVIALAALVIGIRWHKPAVPRAWWLLVASQTVYTAADATFYIRHYLLHLDAFPSYPDALYLAHLPLAAAALLMLIRRRMPGGDRAGLAEGGVVMVSAALLSWVFLLQPTAAATGTSLAVKLASMAFPVCDLALAVVCIRLLTLRRERILSGDLLLLSFGVLIVADTIYGLMQLAGTYTTGNFIDGIWILSYGCLGAAALHPSMRFVGATRVVPKPLTKARFAMLAPWAFLPPALLVIEVATSASNLHAAEIGVAAIAVAALVTWRTMQLVGVQHRAIRLAATHRDALESALEELRDLQEQKAALLERTMHVGELERTRVAIELHDGPIQRLASVAYVIDASTAAVNGDPDQARRCLESLRDRVGAEVEGLRRIMAELRPPVLDHGGLVPALDDYVIEFGRTHDVETTLVDGLSGTRVGGKAEIAVYRVVQEALANVAKHARATHVEVGVTTYDGVLEVTIRDDGVGFDLTTLSRTRDHFGLDAIRERMTNVGGTVDLKTAPGHGTTVVARAPLPLADVA